MIELAAMDLVAGARRVIVAMEHTTKIGDPKILEKWTLPITGLGVVNMIVMDLGVIQVTPEGLVLEEVAPGVLAKDVQSVTAPKLKIASSLTEMAF